MQLNLSFKVHLTPSEGHLLACRLVELGVPAAPHAPTGLSPRLSLVSTRVSSPTEMSPLQSRSQVLKMAFKSSDAMATLQPNSAPRPLEDKQNTSRNVLVFGRLDHAHHPGKDTKAVPRPYLGSQPAGRPKELYSQAARRRRCPRSGKPRTAGMLPSLAAITTPLRLEALFWGQLQLLLHLGTEPHGTENRP